jgi:hypothetical protein
MLRARVQWASRFALRDFDRGAGAGCEELIEDFGEARDDLRVGGAELAAEHADGAVTLAVGDADAGWIFAGPVRTATGSSRGGLRIAAVQRIFAGSVRTATGSSQGEWRCSAIQQSGDEFAAEFRGVVVVERDAQDSDYERRGDGGDQRAVRGERLDDGADAGGEFGGIGFVEKDDEELEVFDRGRRDGEGTFERPLAFLSVNCGFPQFSGGGRLVRGLRRI